MTSESVISLAEAINTLEPPSPDECAVPTVSSSTYSNVVTKFRADLWRFMVAVGTLPGGKDLLSESAIVEKFIELDLMRNDALAQELHAYMTFRAKLECKPHRHDVSYYSNILLNQRKASLRKRIAGVGIGDHSLLSDAKNPAAFEAWHESRRHRVLSKRQRPERRVRPVGTRRWLPSRKAARP